MSSTKTKGTKKRSQPSTSKKPQKKAKAGSHKAKSTAKGKWSDKPRNKMVGFWFDEAELKAFDSALVKANYTKPNGTANRADYLKDMAKELVKKFGTVADKKVFGEKPAKSAKKSTKKEPAKNTEKMPATASVGAVG